MVLKNREYMTVNYKIEYAKCIQFGGNGTVKHLTIHTTYECKDSYGKFTNNEHFSIAVPPDYLLGEHDELIGKTLRIEIN